MRQHSTSRAVKLMPVTLKRKDWTNVVCNDSKVSTLPATICKRGITIFENVSSMQGDSDTKHVSSLSSYNPVRVLCKFNAGMSTLQPVHHCVYSNFCWILTTQTSIALIFDKLFNITKHLM